MERDYGEEIDALQKEMSEIKTLLQELVQQGAGVSGKPRSTSCTAKGAAEQKTANEKAETAGVRQEGRIGDVAVISDMHPDKRLSGQMEELCSRAGEQGISGLINYMGVFASGGRQSNWIRHQVNTDMLLELIENHTAEKVLGCIGNSARLEILLAILRKPRTVAELVTVCGLNSTGQAYHHMKPLLAADLIAEDDASGGKGVYIVRPHKVQGIIMLLAGISDMVDETYTKGSWEML